jgi:hypothetical protein
MRLQEDSQDIIELDIGGTHRITTTRNTLCKYKYSGLAAMFSGRHAMQYNKDQVCFMDRDGDPFCKLISFLRTGQLPVITDKKQEHLFREEMIYWQIPFDGNEEEEKGVSILLVLLLIQRLNKATLACNFINPYILICIIEILRKSNGSFI